MADLAEEREYRLFCGFVAESNDIRRIKLAIIDLATYLRAVTKEIMNCNVDCGQVLQGVTLQISKIDARVELLRDIVDRLEAEGVLSRKAN